MRSSSSLPTTVAATAYAAALTVALCLLSPNSVLASESPRPVLGPHPDFRASLDESDEHATLDAIHTALTEVADGSSYVWHRHHGRLSAVLQPTQSFKDQSGQVCRHIVVMLVSGKHSARSEGIACRLGSGRWQLDG